MNGWLALACLAALFAAGMWFQTALGKALWRRDQRRDAEAEQRRLAANRHPSSRSRIENGMDFMLWDKQIKREVER